jgi:hypothetical protein
MIEFTIMFVGCLIMFGLIQNEANKRNAKK